MIFPRYPKYKDSGVEWLDEVPEHWNITSLRRLVGSIESGTSVNAIDQPAGADEFGVLKTSCVYTGVFDPGENKAVVPDEYVRLSCALRVGTLIVSRMNTPDLVGAAGIVKDAPGNLYLPDRLWQISFTGAIPEFLHYWSQSSNYRGQIRSVCVGTSASMQNLGQDQYRSFMLAEPPVEEQSAIASLLDRELEKIDLLVEEQRRLIELLKEKRQAVISHVVTKGLNPDAPLKDSGIEWVERVPTHWKIQRLSTVCRFESGMAHEPYIDDDGEFICVNSRFISTDGESRKYCTKNLSPARKNDILMVMSDLPNGRALAKAFFVREDGPYAVNQRVCILSPYGAHPKYLYYYLNRNPELLSHDDGFNQTHLWNDLFTKLPTLIPSLREQSDIAALLDKVTADIDALISEAGHSVELLHERRTALISAAVTGKIDVRQAVAECVA